MSVLCLSSTPRLFLLVQSGRFGKLNKRVTFPETLDLSPYMSELEDGNDTYKLYAVIVHVDMLNASYFGHYICYIKDFCGSWYRIDDCRIMVSDLPARLCHCSFSLSDNQMIELAHWSSYLGC